MKVRLTNYKKAFPKAEIKRKLFSIDRFYSGRMIHFNVKHFTLEFDFRK